MNDKENLKVAVIECCVNGTMTIKVAADRLKFSERYVKELKAIKVNTKITKKGKIIFTNLDTIN